ncbi:MAG: formate dehydrogenase accessory protein FdhE [Anaerolineae bacterium]|nr:formate dehydrogenase accessory protein FdhE [Anaerolineae bacterium]
MRAVAPTGLDDLASADPSVAPLVALYQVALAAVQDAAWQAALPSLDPAQVAAAREGLAVGQPLLHGQTFVVDSARLDQLLSRLLDGVERSGQLDGWRWRAALTGSESSINPLSLLEASLALASQRLEALAQEAGLDAALLSTLGQLAAGPLLAAWRQATAPLLNEVPWHGGYCPHCGAWPSLAEVRGLDREHWLRCGRCSAAWKFSTQTCVFCGNTDYETLTYLAPEAAREARRAVTCHDCLGYLKTVTTIGALSLADLARQDLQTLELDAAALDRGYGRPAHSAFPLQVTVLAEKVDKRRSWFGWKR